MNTESKEQFKHKYPQFEYVNEFNMNMAFQQNELSRLRIEGDHRFDSFDKSIIDGIFRPNSDFLPGGRYYDAIEGPIKEDASDIDTVADIGISVGAMICEENSSAKGRIVGYLNAVGALDYTKIGLLGGERSTVTTNGIADYIRLTVASELPMTQQAMALVDAVHDTLLRSADAYPNDEIFNWFSAKAHFLKSVYKRQYMTRVLAANYNEEFSDDEESEKEIRDMAKLLTKEAMQHRKYGTKPAYIEASIGGSWIFYDGDDWTRTLHRGTKRKSSEQYDNVAAVIFHSPFEKLESLKASVEYDASGVGMLTGAISKAEPDTQLYVTKEGSISLDPEGLQDIAFIGLPKPQELAFRAELSSIFYDLSMPTYKNRKEGRNFATLTTSQKESFDPIQDLLIPRVRLVGKAEVEKSDIVRTVREHDVTWFVRVLPAGYRSSPEAVIEAANQGIVLEENETFVRAHSRGSLQKPLGYRALRRT